MGSVASDTSKELSKISTEVVKMYNVQERIRSRSFVERESLEQEVRLPPEHSTSLNKEEDDGELLCKNVKFGRLPPLGSKYIPPLITESNHPKITDVSNITNNQKVEFSTPDKYSNRKIRGEPKFYKNCDLNIEGLCTLSAGSNQESIKNELERKNKKSRVQSLNAINNQDKNEFNCVEVINSTITASLVKITYDKKLENKQDIEELPIKRLSPLQAINNIKMKVKYLRVKILKSITILIIPNLF